jgi:uncharacterized membrane protein (DUF106 family)
MEISTSALVMLIFGVLISIIGYFLKKTMEDLKDVQKMAQETKIDLGLVKLDTKNKYDNLLEKIEQLFETNKEIISELKQIKDKMIDRR